MSIRCRFSKAIYYARKEMGITQAQAAEALDISVRWFQIIENGRCLPSATLALKFVAYFGIDGKTLRKDAEYESVGVQVGQK